MPGPVISVSDIGLLALPGVQLFADTFDSGLLDTTNRWQQPTTGGGCSVTTVIGAVTLNGGAGGGLCALSSLPQFRPTEPGFLIKVARVNLEFPVLLNWYRFFGLATLSSAPTITSPVIEAAGFEVTTAGRLFAVTYQTGARVPIADLSQLPGGTKVQPQDSAAHKYYVWFRGDYIAWLIDEVIVAEIQTGANGPNANTLGMTQILISNGGASGAFLQLNGVAVSDSARTTVTLSDGNFGWRKQTVTAAGAALVQAVGGVNIGLNNPAGGVDLLRTDGAGRLNDSNEDLLRQLIREVRVTNRLLLVGLNVDTDIDANQDTDYD
jgi:hypothetical protein